MNKDNREHRVAFRVSDEEKAVMKAIAQRMDRTESDAMRVMIKEFAAALGLSSGKATIRVKVETIGELPY